MKQKDSSFSNGNGIKDGGKGKDKEGKREKKGIKMCYLHVKTPEKEWKHYAHKHVLISKEMFA